MSGYVPAAISEAEVVFSRAAVEGLDVSAKSGFLREVELRCPLGPKKLFAKLRVAGEQTHITSENLIEMACQDCRRRLRQEGREVEHVLHRFDIAGALIETVFVNRES